MAQAFIHFGDAALAQLVEHRIRNAGVRGSNPLSGTITLPLVKPRLLLNVNNHGYARGYGVGGALCRILTEHNVNKL